MPRKFAAICAVAGTALVSGTGFAAETRTISPAAFTDRVIASLRARVPELRLDKIGELRLKLVDARGKCQDFRLGNTYRRYERDPTRLDELVRQHVAAALEPMNGDSAELDLSRVVPVVRDVGFIAETGAPDPMAACPDEGFRYASDRYNDLLVVLYAEDTPKSIRFLTEDVLRRIGPTPDARRARVVRNLRALLPQLEIVGGRGVLALEGADSYTSSLILLDEIWPSLESEVAGDIVIAIPSREILLVTGADDPAGLERVRDYAGQIVAQSPYRISDRLFVRRGGRFVPLAP